MKCFMEEDYKMARAEAARVANFKRESARRKEVLADFYGKPLDEIRLEDGHYESTVYMVLRWKRARFQVLTSEEVWGVATQSIHRDWVMYSDDRLLSKHSTLSEPQIGVLRGSLSADAFQDIMESIITGLDNLKDEALRIYGDAYFIKCEQHSLYKGWHIFRLERTKGRGKK